MTAELVPVNRRVANGEVCLDAVSGARSRIVVVLNQIELHQCRARRACGVELDATDVVLDDVVDDLRTALVSGETWVHPDSGKGARIGKSGPLNGKPIEHDVIGFESQRPAFVVDDRLRTDTCPRIIPGLRATESDRP